MHSRSRDARWALLSQVVTSGGNFATTLVLVRSLGLEGFGQFSICFLLTMLTRNFLTSTVLTPMSTIGPRLRPASLPAYRGFLVANAIAFALGTSVLLVAAAAPLSLLLDASWLSTLALATAAANLTGTLCDTLRRYHFVYEAPARACLVDAIRFTTQICGLLLLATIPGVAVSPETALLILAAAGLAGIVIGMPHQTPPRISLRFWRAIWPRHWNFIRWMTPGAALESLQSTGLMLIAAALFSEATIGLLRAIEGLANLVLVPVHASTAIATIAASRALRQGGHGLMWRELIFVTLVTGLSALAASVLVTTPAMKTLVVQSAWDWNSNMLLLLFLAANILTIVRLPLVAAVQAIELPHLNFLVACASAASGLCVLFVAAPAHSGAAVAAARVAVVLFGIILTWVALRVSTADGARLSAR